MKGLEFPIVGTRVKGLRTKFDLSDPKERKKYFSKKVGPEIRKIRKYLKNNTFIAYMLGKKNSGKGTYTKLFTEAVGEEYISHLSVGDVVRDAHASWEKFEKTGEVKKIEELYRGYISFKDATNTLLGRSTSKLLPTEFTLALLKYYVAKAGRKTIFVDGLPRETDQISYSLFFRDLINYRDDLDVFILIDIPERVIEERIKYRRVCPKCHTPRNIKLLLTSEVEYDAKAKEFFLICDNPECEAVKMVAKEGDDLGLDPIRPRLEKDEEILKKAFSLHGVPKVLLRNHVSVNDAKKYFDHYEITPAYSFKNTKTKVKVIESPWIIKDDNGVRSHSLLAAPVVVSMIKQLTEILK